MINQNQAYDPNDPLYQRVIQSVDPSQGVTGTDTQNASTTPDPAPFTQPDNSYTQPATPAAQPSPQPAAPSPAPVNTAPTVAQIQLPQPAAPAAAPAPSAGAQPSGGSINDPGYLNSLIAWAATQPGVNPSVIRDPNYWVSAAPRFNGDQGYFVQRMFTPEGPPEGSSAPAAAPAAAPTAAPAAVPGAPSSSASSDAANQAFLAFLQQYQQRDATNQQRQDELRAFIMQQLQNAAQPVNETDQNIAAPLSAARDEVARSSVQERNALAERLYGQNQGGLNSNALTQGIQQSSERNAGALSSLRASLLSNEYQARRTQMTQLLSQALASGDAQAAQSIQVEIAALDAEVQREGLGTNLAEFTANLNQNAAQAGLNG